MKIVVITGMSGSGKSTAVRALEDEGFYCIDNLPVRLFKTFVDLIGKTRESFSGIALVTDIRGRELLKGYDSAFRRLRMAGHSIEILFFDASDESLIRRFSETRRRHPVDEHCSIPEGIRIERERLSGLRQIATRIIDTSEFNVHQLKEVVVRAIRGDAGSSQFTIEVQSFGFKYGIPMESGIVMDMRFLPNPFFVPELKPLTGLDQPVKKYVTGREETQEFLNRFLPLLDLLVPAYQREGKTYLTISIGCTGGRHRSVAVAEVIARHLREQHSTVRLTHRDIEKGLLQ